MPAHSSPETDYLPIAEHGVIGDLHTVALVGTDGTIDWYCTPRFDSPSVFASILDKERGGFYRIAPAAVDYTVKQLYFPDTNVLITRFLTPDGVAEVEDFMPIHRDPHHQRHLVRRVVGVRGEMRLRVECQPRFDYGRASHEVEIADHGALFRSPTLTLALSTEVPLERRDAGVVGEFTLSAEQTATFALEQADDGVLPPPLHQDEATALFERTVRYWRGWLGQLALPGPVARDGAPLRPDAEAPDLPSDGRDRGRSDQPRCRSSSAASATGTTATPGSATPRSRSTRSCGSASPRRPRRSWPGSRTASASAKVHRSGPLQIMYGIDGRSELDEIVLDHFEGYRGSAPVRVGNGAADQLQLDIYGELMDSVYLYNKYGKPVYHGAWEDLQRIVEWVCENWDQKDEGIWEVRGGPQDFVYSRVMSWVAIERAIRIARFRGLPADLVRWLETRDTIYRQIMARGWNEERQAFVQHYDTDFLDASVLLMPLVKFIAPTDPSWLTTLDAISKELVSDSLVYRYNVGASPDGMRGDEGTFSICSFWYVEALTRAGRVEEAQLAFGKMLTYANHLGLYSEEIGPTGEQLGNFPQAFTHLALISSAFNLDRELG